MASPGKHPTSISPSATVLASSSSSSSTDLSVLSSPSPCLPPELIRLIASRLTSLKDFFALRAACRTYRTVLTPLSTANLAFQAPLIPVPHNGSAYELLLLAPLCCLLSSCLTDINLDPSLTRFHAFGCRVAIDDRIEGYRRHRELRISHLLTGDHARLPNPPKHIDGVIFSGDLVITFKKCHSSLYYSRIGDVHWRAASCEKAYQFYNLVFVKGTLYGLMCPKCRLAVVELHNNSAELSFLGDESTPLPFPGSYRFRLAECRGELLLVVTVQNWPMIFHIFQWKSGEKKWARRTTSLGGCTLFFYIHQFTGCLGPDHPVVVRRDCMYFTWSLGQTWEFCLVDGSWHRRVADYVREELMEDYLSLAWVLPSIIS